MDFWILFRGIVLGFCHSEWTGHREAEERGRLSPTVTQFDWADRAPHHHGLCVTHKWQVSLSSALSEPHQEHMSLALTLAGSGISMN